MSKPKRSTPPAAGAANSPVERRGVEPSRPRKWLLWLATALLLSWLALLALIALRA